MDDFLIFIKDSGDSFWEMHIARREFFELDVTKFPRNSSPYSNLIGPRHNNITICFNVPLWFDFTKIQVQVQIAGTKSSQYSSSVKNSSQYSSTCSSILPPFDIWLFHAVDITHTQLIGNPKATSLLDTSVGMLVRQWELNTFIKLNYTLNSMAARVLSTVLLSGEPSVLLSGKPSVSDLVCRISRIMSFCFCTVISFL